MIIVYITFQDTPMLCTPKVTHRSRIHSKPQVKRSSVKKISMPKTFIRSKCEIEVRIPGVINKKFSANPSELFKWNNLVYYVPFAPRPREQVDSQFIAKLEPNPSDTRFIAVQKESLLKHYQDKYACNVLKWSPYFWSGQFVRWGFYATAGFRVSGLSLTSDCLECVVMAGFIPGCVALLLYGIMYGHLDNHRTYQCLSREIERTKTPIVQTTSRLDTLVHSNLQLIS
jgi:hypothetical protein